MTEAVLDCREIRLKSGLNQHAFWTPLGVTQSGGSRYENGRNVPKPVRHLLNLVYVLKLDLDNVDPDALQVASYLKETQPEEFKRLKKEAKAWSKQK